MRLIINLNKDTLAALSWLINKPLGTWISECSFCSDKYSHEV